MKMADYKQNKAREIMEDAISQLCAVGLDTDGAAGFLVIQGLIRIESQQKRKDLAEFAAREAEDTID